MTHDETTLTAGTNGSVTWALASELGVKRVASVENASSQNASEACGVLGSNALVPANHANHSTNADVPSDASFSKVDCESLVANWTNTEHAAPANLSESNLTATRTGTETRGGVEAYVVSLAHENESVDLRGTVWVATEDSRVLKQRLTDGTNASVVRYHDQRFNVSVHESTFAPPATRTERSTTTYDAFDALQSATDHDLSTLTAEGFTFERATVPHAGDGLTVISSTRAHRRTPRS